MEKVKPTILYVDDEPSNLTVFTAAFRRYYNVLTALSAHEGMELLCKNKDKIELIITDQRMPEMTGVQFLEAVIPTFPDPVRMILTGFSDVEAIIKAVNNGSILRYIMKPWDIDELKQIIDIGIKIYEFEKNNSNLYDKLKIELEKQNQVIDLFKKYVPLHVINKMSDDNQDKPLNGEFRIVSILFSDIRNFTKLSERIDPKILVSYLNQYFSIMINCVIKNEGTVYKFLGDGLIAIFGAPTSSLNNQHNATMCALEMIEALKEFNVIHGKEIQHQAEIGIGISTGETMVGNIITENFLSYLAIGKAVDLALKVEDLTHGLPNSILITESTYQRIKDDFQVELLRSIDIDDIPEKIYKIIGTKLKN